MLLANAKSNLITSLSQNDKGEKLVSKLTDLFTVRTKYNTDSTSLDFKRKVAPISGFRNNDGGFNPTGSEVTWDIDDSGVISDLILEGSINYTPYANSDVGRLKDTRKIARLFSNIRIVASGKTLCSYDWTFIYSLFLMSDTNKSLNYQACFSSQTGTGAVDATARTATFAIPLKFFFTYENWYNCLHTNLMENLQLKVTLSDGVGQFGAALNANAANELYLTTGYRNFTGQYLDYYDTALFKSGGKLQLLCYDTFLETRTTGPAANQSAMITIRCPNVITTTHIMTVLTANNGGPTNLITNTGYTLSVSSAEIFNRITPAELRIINSKYNTCYTVVKDDGSLIQTYGNNMLNNGDIIIYGLMNDLNSYTNGFSAYNATNVNLRVYCSDNAADYTIYVTHTYLNIISIDKKSGKISKIDVL